MLVLAVFGCGGGTSSHDVSSSEPPRAGESSPPAPNDTAGRESTEGPGSSGQPSTDAPDAAAPPEARADATVDAGAQPAPARAFRLTELSLRDPHFFLATTDITDNPVLGSSVNGTLIRDGLTMDFDDDGFIDLSIVAAFASFDSAAPSAEMRMVDASCPPDAPAQCRLDPGGGLDVQWTIENRANGTCLEPVAGTTSAYSPAVTAPSAPCFVTTEQRDLTIDLGGIRIAMIACSVAASYDAGGQRLVDGLIAGFVTDANAMQALLPSYLPLLAGSPVSDFLNDDDHDLEQSPTDENGFWLYLNFEAEMVEYDE